MGLSVSDESLDFGLVPASSEFLWRLPIENRSREQVVIDTIKTSCSCTVAGEQRLTIDPGKTGTVLLRLNLANAHGNESKSRPFSVTIVAGSSATNRSQQWFLRGRVADNIRLSAYELNLGQLLRGESATHGYRLDVDSVGDLAHVEILQSPRFRVERLPTGVSAGQVSFEIFANPINRIRRHNFPITVRAETAGGDESLIVATAYCSVVDEIGCSPEPAFLGAVNVGEKLRVQRRLFARTHEKIEIDEVSPSEDASENVVVQLDDGEELILTISPSKVGVQEFVVNIKWHPVVPDGTHADSTSLDNSELRFNFVGLQ